MSQSVTVFGQSFDIPDSIGQTLAGFTKIAQFLAALAQDSAINAKPVTATLNLTTDVGTIVTNAGSTAATVLTLPLNAPAGTTFTFLETVAHNVQVVAPTGLLSAAGQAAKTSVTLGAIGSSISIVSDGAAWHVLSVGLASTVTYA